MSLILPVIVHVKKNSGHLDIFIYLFLQYDFVR